MSANKNAIVNLKTEEELRDLVLDMQESLEAGATEDVGFGFDAATKTWKERIEAILPSRTMADVEWDDTEHRFAGAEAEDGYELVMLERRWVEGHPDLYVILCVDPEGRVDTWMPELITPTGRKYRLEPTDSVPKDGPIETEIDPDYIYRDRHGDVWECLDGRWIIGSTHNERVAIREESPGRASLPEVFGPYRKVRLAPAEGKEIPGDAEKEHEEVPCRLDSDGDHWVKVGGQWHMVDPDFAYDELPERYGPYRSLSQEGH